MANDAQMPERIWYHSDGAYLPYQPTMHWEWQSFTRSDLCASGQQVRALAWKKVYEVESEYFAGTVPGTDAFFYRADNEREKEEAEAMHRDKILAALTPDPQALTADQWRNSPAHFATHGITAAPPAATPTAQEAVPFQNRVQPWMNACFGPEISADRLERGDRMLEEVFELLQSGGYPRDRVASLSSYVWSRPEGEPAQEVGGVMVTLAAYCLAHDLDMHEAGETELARVWTKVEKIRAKQAAKPFGSALPQEWPVAAHPPQPARPERIGQMIISHDAYCYSRLGKPCTCGASDCKKYLLDAYAEIERLTKERDEAQTDLGKVILALPTGKGERAAGPVEGVKTMRKRLEAERNEARAQMAMVYEVAAQTAKGEGESEFFNPVQAIRALTPADAQASLEAYAREKVREGMQHMLNRLRHEGNINPALTYADAIEWAEYILADMETLK